MTHPLSASAQRVQDTLNRLGYTYQVMESETHTRTAQQAADLVGCELGQIVKSLIFKGKESLKPILVLTSGTNRVDEGLISQYAGESIQQADADFVRAVTGFAIGGVPPVGHTQAMETYLDQDLLRFDAVWAAGGTPNSLFELSPASLKDMSGATVVEVKEISKK